MDKIWIIVLVVLAIIVSFLALFFSDIFYDYKNHCGQYLTFEYDEQDYINPINEVKGYLSENIEDKINVDKIGGYGSSAPNADPPIPTIWHIQLQDRWMKTSSDIEIIKDSLKNNPKVSNLQGPFETCEVLDRLNSES